ncbi:HEPN domain-containing protein [Spirosoma gilvum]
MKEQVARFLEHAQFALDDADYLYHGGRILAVANRAYYAIFYCVCALLASEGVYTKKHQGARAKFSELFVKTGRFDAQSSKIVGNNFAARQSADYDMEAFLSDEEAKLLLDDARTFYELTTTYFAQNPIV